MHIPSGATHVAEGNIYYRKAGKFWFRYSEVAQGWLAISGEPSLKVVEIQSE